jgi:hypothetical protein
MMIGGVAQQSPMRLHNQLLSRSDGCSQGRREPTRSAREPLTASPSAGYPCARHLTQLLKPDTLDPSGCQRKSQVLHVIIIISLGRDEGCRAHCRQGLIAELNGSRARPTDRMVVLWVESK